MTDKTDLLPTVPGMLEGIVGYEPQPEGPAIVTTQCQVCGVTERAYAVIALRAICYRDKLEHGGWGLATYRRCCDCIENRRYRDD